jgi:outer membrane protein assembly factor BamB
MSTVGANGVENWNYTFPGWTNGGWLYLVLDSSSNIYYYNRATYQLFAFSPIGTLLDFKLLESESLYPVGANPSIAVGPNDVIYVQQSGYLYAFILNSSGILNQQWYMDSPCLDSTIIVGNDGTLYLGGSYQYKIVFTVVKYYHDPVYALDPTNGTVRWSIPHSGADTSQGLALSVDGSILFAVVPCSGFLCGRSGYLLAYNATQGTFLWTVGLTSSSTSSLTVGSTLVYMGTNEGVFAIASDGSVRWVQRNTTFVNKIGLLGDVIYLVSYSDAQAERLAKLNALTGEIMWTKPYNYSIFHFAIVPTDGSLFLATRYG